MGLEKIVLSKLRATADLARVEAVYGRAADYLALEGGLSPAQAAQGFFEDCPPVCSEEPLKFGVSAGGDELIAIGDLAFGYPDPADAYIGLLLLVPERRGSGLGALILEEVKRVARARDASTLLIGILDANVRGRAFWERQGFSLVQTSGPHIYGNRRHVVHRLALSLVDKGDDCR